MAKKTPNIAIPEWHAPEWGENTIERSLEQMRSYVEQTAQAAIDWYYRNKRVKAKASQLLRAFAILATAAGGLLPIAVSTGAFDTHQASAIETTLRHAQVNQIGYICIGLAALALAFDRFFGTSTGWMRYITTAMSLESALMQFRVDWAKLSAPLGGRTPTGSELDILIKRMSDLILTVRALVETETKQWAAEFQTNLTELEKQAKTALDVARATAEDTEKDAEKWRDALHPGAIELTVENAADSDSGYNVEIDGKLLKSGVVAELCALRNVAPGLREIAVNALIDGMAAHDLQIVNVEANIVLKTKLKLMKVRATAMKQH